MGKDLPMGLGWLEIFVWVISLCAVTVVLIFVAEQFVEIRENLQVYYMGILAGGTGGMWSYGIARAYDFCKELEKEGLKNSLRNHLIERIAILIIASVIIMIVVRIVRLY